jgi:selenoprotein W-related protein
MKYQITIEYCPKCNWMMRAAWIAQELLVTFENELDLVSLKPSINSGSFLIYVGQNIVFDRKTHGSFAEPKVIKQLVRDFIAPAKNLGHSDKKNL